MKIAIDFDGVLIDRQGIKRDDGFDMPPIKDAVDAVKYLNGKFDCYICTARQSHEWLRIKRWMKHWGFPVMKVTNKKQPSTFIYLDDRAVRFTNWLDFCKLLK